MLSVLKLDLEYGLQRISIPQPAQILGVASETGQPILYVLQDDTKQEIELTLYTVRTGEEIKHAIDSQSLKYIGSVEMSDSPMLCHVFWLEHIKIGEKHE